MSGRKYLGKRKYNVIEKEKNDDNDLTKVIAENLFQNMFDKKKKTKKIMKKYIENIIIYILDLMFLLNL